MTKNKELNLRYADLTEEQLRRHLESTANVSYDDPKYHSVTRWQSIELAKQITFVTAHSEQLKSSRFLGFVKKLLGNPE